MPTDNEVILTIRELLRMLPATESVNSLEMANALAAELERLGDRRAVQDLRATIRLEATAMGRGLSD